MRSLRFSIPTTFATALIALALLTLPGRAFAQDTSRDAAEAIYADAQLFLGSLDAGSIPFWDPQPVPHAPLSSLALPGSVFDWAESDAFHEISKSQLAPLTPAELDIEAPQLAASPLPLKTGALKTGGPGSDRSARHLLAPQEVLERKIVRQRAQARAQADALYAESRRLLEARAVRQKARERGFFAAPPPLYPAGSRPQEKLWAAARQYQRTGKARTIQIGSTKILPYGDESPFLYGKGQPTIVTSVLRSTFIELAPNEYVIDKFVPDSRFTVEIGKRGNEEGFTQVISVEPQFCGLRSNMGLSTNQGRLYRMELVSLDCDMDSGRMPARDAYMRHVRWWYPNGTGQDHEESGEPNYERVPAPSFDSGRSALQARREEAEQEDGDLLSLIDLREANTNYDIEIDRRFPCAPNLVADEDGIMYIRFPKEQPLCRQRFPLFVEGEDRDLQVVNYTVFDGNVYVVEGTPIKTVLMYRTSRGRERRVEITNEKLEAVLRERR